jgi:hypothetical protein
MDNKRRQDWFGLKGVWSMFILYSKICVYSKKVDCKRDII